jgi:hypothetical protein
LRAGLLAYINSQEPKWIEEAKKEIDPEKIVRNMVSEIRKQIDRMLPEKKI